jgi:hypothetical protein
MNIDELVESCKERSRPGELEAIARRVERTGGCARPIRLKATGHNGGYSSAGEPDGVLLIACRTRRESRCPPCAATYRGDARHLVLAGLEGGKGVPESVRHHPAVFLTLTAPSFGPVHRSTAGPCHFGRPGRCRHGRSTHCLERHDGHDAVVGTPLCCDCYSYVEAVLFNNTAGELWRRVSIYAFRYLAYAMATTEKALRKTVRLSYVKAAELQRRGVVHLHVVVRADAAGAEVAPPPGEVTTGLLIEALTRAVQSVRVTRELDGRQITLGFGTQLRIEAVEGQVSGVARYLAKYLSKDASESGALDHRLREGELEHLDLPEHLARIVATAWYLGADEGRRRFRRWAHALAFSGHVLTKSKRYSTTFKALRIIRYSWRIHESAEPRTDDTAVTAWNFAGAGHRHVIDSALAATFAGSHGRPMEQGTAAGTRRAAGIERRTARPEETEERS